MIAIPDVSAGYPARLFLQRSDLLGGRKGTRLRVDAAGLWSLLCKIRRAVKKKNSN